MLRLIQTLTRYNAWANDRVFDAVTNLPAGEAIKRRVTLFDNIVHTLNHNHVIGLIFQAHLEDRDHGFTARNTPDHPPLEALWQSQRALDAWYIDWGERIGEAALGEIVAFTFIGGARGAMTRAEIVAHVVNHATYHRGFIADLFFQVPAQPPTTDLPVFVRDARKDSG